MKQETASVLKQYKNSNLRTACSAWAGGKTEMFFAYDSQLKQPICETTTLKAWSSNGKWSGNNLHIRLLLPTQGWTTDLIGGVFTISRKVDRKRNPKAYTAYWLVQSRGYSVKVVKGFVVRGYHIEGNDINKANKKVAKIRSEAAQNLLKNRIMLKDAATVWVTVNDSIKSGNCTFGTENFVKELQKNLHTNGMLGAVRGDVILRVRNDFYTRRAIAIAEHKVC